MIGASPHPRARLSLIELVVGLAILGAIIVVSASVLLTLERGSAVSATTAGLDQDVRRVLSELRTCLRQSGFHQDDSVLANRDRILSTIPEGVPTAPDESLALLVRTDFVYAAPGGTVYGADEKATLDWGAGRRFRLVADGGVDTPSGTIPTFRLEEVVWRDLDQDGAVDAATEVLVVPLCLGVSRFMARRVQDSVFEITLEVTRTNPDRGATPSEPIQLRAVERVQLLNPKVRDTSWTDVATPPIEIP